TGSASAEPSTSRGLQTLASRVSQLRCQGSSVRPRSIRARDEPMEYLRRWAELIGTPTDPERIEAHRDTVILRTRTSAIVAMIVIPATIFVYFPLEHPFSTAVALT